MLWIVQRSDGDKEGSAATAKVPKGGILLLGSTKIRPLYELCL